MSPSQSRSQATLCVHADDPLNGNVTDVAPALHVSTTYRFAKNPDDLVEAKDQDVSRRLSSFFLIPSAGIKARTDKP
jgi:cystathionine gamma-synthase